ncbi:hypothetical protein H0A36_09460 [Endozoicomonas sp. SM1973]|uniref:Uncharacterized protein n=1 Tax=Spartinivicinus marinus TaxID=2994442 RepID=A0A853I6E4_9GAMM|nr:MULTISPECIES: hypothetical protein [Spartinivicinus]MCX4028086.1 hypothetical protein [Spartinivicinus marinus]NYZ66238.1 hypothetical protein [Spartinivicinus marinus]
MNSKPKLAARYVKSEIDNVFGILSLPYAYFLAYKLAKEEKNLVGK